MNNQDIVNKIGILALARVEAQLVEFNRRLDAFDQRFQAGMMDSSESVLWMRLHLNDLEARYQELELESRRNFELYQAIEADLQELRILALGQPRGQEGAQEGAQEDERAVRETRLAHRREFRHMAVWFGRAPDRILQERERNRQEIAELEEARRRALEEAWPHANP